ncbi:MAG: hypothetical protein Q7S65_02240 [Nanoarchaeota archaeon]|nr:hypothetical protein [Nanoarchaeota archaeon]
MTGPAKTLIGFETELFTLTANGEVANRADRILRQAPPHKYAAIKKECAENLIEVVGEPEGEPLFSVGHLLAGMETALILAEKNETLLCPLGTYPGDMMPAMRKETRYRIQEAIFGKRKWSIAGRCAGFHCHHSLPRGMFDTQLRMLRIIAHLRVKERFVNSYNLMIAADPVLTTFMQSSPYYQGHRLGKDARAIMYRGGAPLDNSEGLYASLEEFGGLPHYKPTALDIHEIISSRYDAWKALLKKTGINLKTLSLYGSTLDPAWNPVKVNAHGTLEQRGMDMNHPQHLLAAGFLIKYGLKRLEGEAYTVLASEIGIQEPFKVEGETIHVPPFAHVRDVLQKRSAYGGMEDDSVHEYCGAFLKMASVFIPSDRRKFIAPFREMVEERRTVSDEIISFAKRRGGAQERIDEMLAREIALRHAGRLRSEIEKSGKMILDLF